MHTYLVTGKQLGLTWGELEGALDTYIEKQVLVIDEDGKVTESSQKKAEAMKLLASMVFPKLIEMEEKAALTSNTLARANLNTTASLTDLSTVSTVEQEHMTNYITLSHELGMSVDQSAAGLATYQKELVKAGVSEEDAAEIVQRLTEHYDKKLTLQEGLDIMAQRERENAEAQIVLDEEYDTSKRRSSPKNARTNRSRKRTSSTTKYYH